MSDVSKTNEALIAEIREDHQPQSRGEGKPLYCAMCVPIDYPCDASRLADALEAATRVPVQGEPNDELIEYALDYIENGTMRPERREALRALALRATVPDAATEARKLSIMNGWLVELVGEHTCGTGPDGHYGAHEPGCGYEPHLNLADLEGWPGAERDAATAVVDRVRAAVEKHKHWNEDCGWDVPTIEVLAALDGAPEPEEKP